MRKFLAPAVAVAFLTTAVPAGAATQLGATTANRDCNVPGALFWHKGAPYLAPGKGVITALTAAAGTGPAQFSLKVIRPSGTPTILFSTAAQTIAAPGGQLSLPVRVPVEAGDTLGIWFGNQFQCAADAPPSQSLSAVMASADQPAGAIQGTIENTDTGDAFLAIGATWEPDADGDGFGDESQDGCASDATITSGPCDIDAALSVAASPTSIELGDIAVVDVSVANPSSSTLRAPIVTASVPPGLSTVLVAPRTCAFAALLTCPLGDFAGVASREATIVVRGDKAGTYSVPVSLSASTPDANAANNSGVATITVTAKEARAACKVPNLKGKTKSFARDLLKAAGCKLGKSKTKTVKKGRSGRVTAQSRKAGSTQAVGTAVDITLSKRAKQRK